MSIYKSGKRSYNINLTEKQFGKTVRFLESASPRKLQNYIDYCFEKSNKLGSSSKSGAWAEGKAFKDKAKLAILYKEGWRNYGTIRD